MNVCNMCSLSTCIGGSSLWMVYGGSVWRKGDEWEGLDRDGFGLGVEMACRGKVN